MGFLILKARLDVVNFECMIVLNVFLFVSNQDKYMFLQSQFEDGTKVDYVMMQCTTTIYDLW